MNVRYPLATATWDEAEYRAIQSVVDSGMFTMGVKVQAFEQQFAKHIGRKYCVMVNSGSSANLLMTAALFYSKNPANTLSRGDEVIVPAVSWSTTYSPLYQYGLHIKFVDIDPETLNFDLNKLRDAVTDRTRAILAVNLLGNPNDFAEIRRIIGARNILLLEDNCESLGAEFGGQPTGTFGLMGTFSTFFSHHISTMEGGLIVTEDEEIYHILLALRAHGWTRNLPDPNLVCGKKSPDPFEEAFRFVLPGYNVRPLEIEAAIGIEQLKKLPGLIRERRKNGLAFQQVMRDHPTLQIQKEVGCSSWFGFSLVIKRGSGVSRDALLKRLHQAGFECRPIVAGNFAKNPVVQYFDHEIHGGLPNADYIDQNGLFVGNHHYPIPDAIAALAKM